MPSLFDPIKLGAVTAQNRILMAPLTRARATMNHVVKEWGWKHEPRLEGIVE